MTKSVLLAIGKGILIGGLLFVIPKIMLGIALLFFLVKLLFYKRISRKWKSGNRFAFADKMRSMSDEAYEEFKSNYKGHCCKHQSAVN